MSGGTDLEALLANLNPVLADGEFVFLTFPDASFGDGSELNPVASFVESEGLSLIVPRERAESAGEEFDRVFRMITLRVHSSLEAVGLTAAVAAKLADKGISANVIAAFHHDHVFVPADRAVDAMKALQELQSDRKS